MIRERSIDTNKRVELIEHYKKLQSLHKGMTPQKRGQLFNNLISRILNEYGWKSKPNYNEGTGEIDVAFKIKETRYILEAKWETGRIDINPISKIFLRLKQRLAGTIGIVLSISGFTKPAIKETEQLGILLLTKEHFEAILFGLITPQLLFESIQDNAHFNGNPLSPLVKLSDSGFPKESIIWSFDNTDKLKVKKSFEIEPVFKSLRKKSSISLLNFSQNHGLITELDGFPISINKSRNTTSDLVGIPNCGFFPINKNDYYLIKYNSSCIGIYSKKRLEIKSFPGKLIHNQILIFKSGEAMALIIPTDEYGHFSQEKPSELININTGEITKLQHYFFNICLTPEDTLIGITPNNQAAKDFTLIEFDKNGKSLKKITTIESWNPRISMANKNEIRIMSDKEIKLLNLKTKDIELILESKPNDTNYKMVDIISCTDKYFYFSAQEYEGSEVAKCIYKVNKN